MNNGAAVHASCGQGHGRQRTARSAGRQREETEFGFELDSKRSTSVPPDCRAELCSETCAKWLGRCGDLPGASRHALDETVLQAGIAK
jgi:hypothetical protein